MRRIEVLMDLAPTRADNLEAAIAAVREASLIGGIHDN
jgi:hypothetical protein